MIKSKARYNTVFALSMFLLFTFAVFFFLLNALLVNPESYFYLKLVLAPMLLVISLLVLSKLLASIQIITIRDGRFAVKFPITRNRYSYPVKDLLSWAEETVKTKQGDFKSCKILLPNKKIIKLSNKESTNYDKVVKYLKQKAKKQENKGLK